MRLVSVNVSLPKTVPYGDETLTTGIYKEAVSGRVMLRPHNLEGDGQADLKNHGGSDKAVYCYPHEHYAAWSAELGRDDFVFGQFGENFTVEGLLEDSVCIGDVYQVGQARVQVTQPRTPCYKLEHKMQEEGFIKRFQESRRSGFYVSVLDSGEVGAGDAIQLDQRDPIGLTVREAFDLLLFDKDNAALLARALSVPALAESWREVFSRRLNPA